jgi:hypothetical protein
LTGIPPGDSAVLPIETRPDSGALRVWAIDCDGAAQAIMSPPIMAAAKVRPIRE